MHHHTWWIASLIYIVANIIDTVIFMTLHPKYRELKEVAPALPVLSGQVKVPPQSPGNTTPIESKLTDLGYEKYLL
jgi:hypothetical protein